MFRLKYRTVEHWHWHCRSAICQLDRIFIDWSAPTVRASTRKWASQFRTVPLVNFANRGKLSTSPNITTSVGDDREANSTQRYLSVMFVQPAEASINCSGNGKLIPNSFVLAVKSSHKHVSTPASQPGNSPTIRVVYTFCQILAASSSLARGVLFACVILTVKHYTIAIFSDPIVREYPSVVRVPFHAVAGIPSTGPAGQ